MNKKLGKMLGPWMVAVGLLAAGCFSKTEPSLVTEKPEAISPQTVMEFKEKKKEIPKLFHSIKNNISVGDYYDYIDDLVAHYDSTLHYPLSEHIIVRANPWLIDSFAHTDYYHLMEQGVFVYDPQSVVILHAGDSLLIPSEIQTKIILDKMANTIIDVNIPEFQMRIIEGSKVVEQFSVRVGQNTKRYLAMAGRDVDLRTRPGLGSIVRINRDPAFINPRNNKRYKVTKRDDGKITKMPRIPWIEPEINGIRYGQLIHPTTNLRTLGKAYSNGCVGTSEGDAWKVYFYAPLGTQVRFRYDLETVNLEGDTTLFKDIYPGFSAR